MFRHSCEGWTGPRHICLSHCSATPPRIRNKPARDPDHERVGVALDRRLVVRSPETLIGPLRWFEHTWDPHVTLVGP